MNASSFKALLFDLGGVLVNFDGIAPLLALTGPSLDREGARRFWLMSPAVRKFETGRCTAPEFAAEVLAELKLQMAPDRFLSQFVSWDRGPMPGALDLLDALRPRFFLACLSNNNELHWRRLCQETALADKFHRCYLSHEIGLMKPDHEAFDYVIGDLKIPPEQILFLDDNVECTTAAQRAGLTACLARGVQEVRSVLSSLQLLRPGD
jgi:glucose-1-phosphatase